MLWSRLKGKSILVYPEILILALASMGPLNAAAVSNPEQPAAWLQQARDEARQDGYELISALELKTLYESGKKFTIIDVRPGYEYQDGHLPHAENLEFDLGDRLEVKPEKQESFIKLLGPDKDRLIVIYCRSFA